LDQQHSLPKVMTIAGSDSGGGAGIQADIKTITLLGGFATSVLTALTAQNTQTVAAAYKLPDDFIRLQFKIVMDDIGTDAAKTGMLADAGIIRTVCDCLRERPVPFLVVDPVMVSKSGSSLLAPDAVQALRENLLPLATIICPNLPEASALLDRKIGDLDAMRAAAQDIAGMGCRYALIKGGHLDGPAVDVLSNGKETTEFASKRLPGKNTHGTGCCFSAAIATFLARGMTIEEAVKNAKRFIMESVRNGLDIGGGRGPMDLLSGARGAGFIP